MTKAKGMNMLERVCEHFINLLNKPGYSDKMENRLILRINKEQ